MPPSHILNAPTRLMKGLGYGGGYQYDYEADEAFSGQNHFPDGLAREQVLPSAKSPSGWTIGRSCGRNGRTCGRRRKLTEPVSRSHSRALGRPPPARADAR
jgi:hypothetical protein